MTEEEHMDEELSLEERVDNLEAHVDGIERRPYPPRRDIRALNAILSTIVFLAILIAVAATLWHGVEQQTKTNIANQATQQKQAGEWQAAYNACQKDRIPRYCVEVAHGQKTDGGEDYTYP